VATSAFIARPRRRWAWRALTGSAAPVPLQMGRRDQLAPTSWRNSSRAKSETDRRVTRRVGRCVTLLAITATLCAPSAKSFRETAGSLHFTLPPRSACRAHHAVELPSRDSVVEAAPALAFGKLSCSSPPSRRHGRAFLAECAATRGWACSMSCSA
jgi:hypothetical protein